MKKLFPFSVIGVSLSVLCISISAAFYVGIPGFQYQIYSLLCYSQCLFLCEGAICTLESGVIVVAGIVGMCGKFPYEK